MRNIQPFCQPFRGQALFAASLLLLGSCVSDDSQGNRSLADEARPVEQAAASQPAEAQPQARASEASEAEAVEGHEMVDLIDGEETEEEPIIEEAAAAGTVKAMGPWVAGDKIASGKTGVKDIEILQVHANGSGDVCGAGKRATLRYVAMLADGKVIDPGKRPFTFRVGGGEAIAGWDVVVAKMRVGDSFTLILPQELAYGPSRGDLKFDMELLSFN